MKKFFTLLVSLVCALNISATDYNLWVFGTRVTSSNASDVMGDGTVKYNASTKTLYFTNAKYKQTATTGGLQSKSVVYNQIDDLTINCDGLEASVSSTNAFGIDAPTTITGRGISIKSTADISVFWCGKDLTIKNAFMSIDAPKSVAFKANASGLKLKLEGYANCATNSTHADGAIADFDDVVMNDNIFDNSLVKYDKTKKRLQKNSSIPTGIVNFGENYGISIGYTNLTYYSCSAQSGINGDATIFYGRDSNTIVLKNHKGNGAINITNKAPNDVKITLQGDNQIYWFQTYKNTTIQGTGSLKTTYATSGMSIANNANLVLKDCKINTTDITSTASSTSKLTIDNASVIAETKDATVSPIKNFASISMNTSSIVYPVGGTYNTTNRGIYLYSSEWKGKVVIDESYGITIAGSPVYRANAANILGDGKVSFDPSTYTLTLNNALIATEGECISTVEDVSKKLTINLKGTNSLTSQKSNGMYIKMQSVVTSSSNGKLVVSAQSGAGIKHHYKMEIKDCTVEASGYNYGIVADSYGGGYTLYVTNSSVNAKGSNGAFHGYSNEYLTNCYVTNVRSFMDGSTETKSGYVYEGNLCKDIQIVPGTGYNVCVGNVRVASVNANDVLGNGKVKYDASSKTLTLNNAKIEGGAEYGIWTNDELAINLVGKNEVTSLFSSIKSEAAKNLTIFSESNGSLKAKATVAIYMPAKGNMFIKDCSLDLVGENYGICGESSKSSALEISNATINIESENGAIYNMSDILFNSNVKVKTPADAVVGTIGGNKAIVDGDGKAIKVLEIAPFKEYIVNIKGISVNSFNCNDILGDGTVSFNPETNVITLDNANISHNAGVAITAGFGDYTIDLKGENTVNGSQAAIGTALGSITITTSSNGTLSCSSTEANSAVLSAPIGVLAIKDCKVDIYNNNGYGLYGGGLGALTIDNADVKVYGKQGCVCDWVTFEMKNCYVASPRPTEIGGTEADKNLGIYQNGAPVKGQFVEIKPGVDAINGIASDAKMDGKIYNLQGIEVDENYKGVVVKNGKKYLNK